MDFINVTSSNVESIKYLNDKMILYVRFNNGTQYHYQNVPSNVYQDFLIAPSKGQFVHTRLKNKYPYQRDY